MSLNVTKIFCLDTAEKTTIFMNSCKPEQQFEVVKSLRGILYAFRFCVYFLWELVVVTVVHNFHG